MTQREIEDLYKAQKEPELLRYVYFDNDEDGKPIKVEFKKKELDDIMEDEAFAEYKTTVNLYDMKELFATIFQDYKEMNEALHRFAKEADRCGHEIHGYDGDDDYDSLAEEVVHVHKLSNLGKCYVLALEYLGIKRKVYGMMQVLDTLGMASIFNKMYEEDVIAYHNREEE